MIYSRTSAVLAAMVVFAALHFHGDRVRHTKDEMRDSLRKRLAEIPQDFKALPGELRGAGLQIQGMFQSATANASVGMDELQEDTKHPITKGLPAVWRRSEEWYAFSQSRVTLPDDHPLVLWHCAGNSQAVTSSALDHAGFMYAEILMIHLMDSAIGWGLAENGRSCPARQFLEATLHVNSASISLPSSQK